MYEPLKRNSKVWNLTCVLVGINSFYTIKWFLKIVTAHDISRLAMLYRSHIANYQTKKPEVII